MRNTPLIIFGLLVVAFAIGLAMPEAQRKAHSPTGLLGTELPALSIVDLNNGEAFNLNALRGKVVLVNMFASWCAPCEVELPEFAALKTLSPDVHVMGIGWHDSPNNLRNWVSEKAAPFDRVWHDPARQIGVQLGIRGVPESFVLDKQGRVRYHLPGPLHEALRIKEVAPLMQELLNE